MTRRLAQNDMRVFPKTKGLLIIATARIYISAEGVALKNRLPASITGGLDQWSIPKPDSFEAKFLIARIVLHNRQ